MNPRIPRTHIEIWNQIQINSVSVWLIYNEHFNWLFYMLEFESTSTNHVLSQNADSMLKSLGQLELSVLKNNFEV